MAYGLCAIWSLNYLKYLLIAFAICARWTGGIYYLHIKLSDCPYVRISSIAKQLMSLSLVRHNLYKLSFALKSVAYTQNTLLSPTHIDPFAVCTNIKSFHTSSPPLTKNHVHLQLNPNTSQPNHPRP